MTRQSPPGQEDPGRNPDPVAAETDQAGTPGEAGGSACWAHLVCPTCGPWSAKVIAGAANRGRSFRHKTSPNE